VAQSIEDMVLALSTDAMAAAHWQPLHVATTDTSTRGNGDSIGNDTGSDGSDSRANESQQRPPVALRLLNCGAGPSVFFDADFGVLRMQGGPGGHANGHCQARRSRLWPLAANHRLCFWLRATCLH